MINKETLSKFGYTEITPFTDLLHAVGLLHTARRIDSKYALSQIKKILNQKYDCFCIAVVYDSSKDGKDVSIGKVFKAGRAGFSDKIKDSMHRSKIEFNSDIGATIIEAAGTNKGMSLLKRSISFSALCSHFNMILIYDVSKNSYHMYKKSNRKSSNAKY